MLICRQLSLRAAEQDPYRLQSCATLSCFSKGLGDGHSRVMGGEEPLTYAGLRKGLGQKHLTDLEQTFNLVQSLGHPGPNKCGVNYFKSNIESSMLSFC